jgi:hypothetical protein
LLIFFLPFLSFAVEEQDSLRGPDSISADNQQLKKWNPIYTGAYSAVIPGAGQVYTGHYLMGGSFLAMEVITASIARFWFTTYEERLHLAQDYQREIGSQKTWKDSMLTFEQSIITRFDAKSAKYTMYNTLSWMIGGYVYNICDALKSSRYFDSDSERNPAKAGLLSAIPGLGLGQIYNGEISKAGRIMMGQISLGVIAVNHHLLMKKAQRNYNETFAIFDSTNAKVVAEKWDSRQENAFKNRNTYLWYSIFFYLYGILDAVVDAHLHDYDRKMQAYPDLIPEQGAIGGRLEYRF